MAPEPQAEPPTQAEAAQEAPGQQQEGTEQQTEQEPPASPPLPQRHTAVSPGPRAARLQELYARSLKKTLGKIGWENVAGCYPTVAKRAEGVLKQVQGQMVDKLGEKCEVRAKDRRGRGHADMMMVQKEFENIMVSRQVVPKLNDLESLISDASHRRAESTTEPPTPYAPLSTLPCFYAKPNIDHICSLHQPSSQPISHPHSQRTNRNSMHACKQHNRKTPYYTTKYSARERRSERYHQSLGLPTSVESGQLCP